MNGVVSIRVKYFHVVPINQTKLFLLLCNLNITVNEAERISYLEIMQFMLQATHYIFLTYIYNL